MGVCNSPGISQEKIYGLFEGFNTVCVYIYDILVITKNYYREHIKAFNKFLQILVEAGLKVNAENSFLENTETKYLGFWGSKYGLRPL